MLPFSVVFLTYILPGLPGPFPPIANPGEKMIPMRVHVAPVLVWARKPFWKWTKSRLCRVCPWGENVSHIVIHDTHATQLVFIEAVLVGAPKPWLSKCGPGQQQLNVL